MDLNGWNERYRSGLRAPEDLEAAPTPLLKEFATRILPGFALDLACGTGRNALWLAQHGWKVTAVDSAPAAIEILRARAAEQQVTVNARVADLESAEYRLESVTWDLVAICYYLQRNLFKPAKRAVKPGGILLAIVHITEPGESPTPHRLNPGELKDYFRTWNVLHYFEGRPNDSAHVRSVAEIVAQRPRGPV